MNVRLVTRNVSSDICKYLAIQIQYEDSSMWMALTLEEDEKQSFVSNANHIFQLFFGEFIWKKKDIVDGQGERELIPKSLIKTGHVATTEVKTSVIFRRNNLQLQAQ